MPSEADHRLPRTVVPSHYALELEPDIGSSTFRGSVTIEVEVIEATDTVVMNAVELDIDEASIETSAETHVATTESDEQHERLVLRTEQTLKPGPATVRIAFEGVINDQLRGFYRATYADEEGNERVFATTQFESTDARRAFPCWDEPDLKASFSITLIVPSGLEAVSNASEADRTDLGDGRTRIEFAETMIMSTYLVAFVVGDLHMTDPVDVDGVPLRIAARPDHLHLADFALEAGAFALRYFASYYDVPYPGGKLDMVAVPDFGFGAMENLGCIIFRETDLLIDTATATQAELSRVASVIAHEIAHMWFGDLVTMKWWNGIWLNEAFATFAETKCTAAFRPEWDFWLVFAWDRARSQETDGLHTTRPVEFPVASPAEADGMFDVLTYEKGSSVLRMLELYLGEQVFREGVSLYLKRHSFGNTDTADLWAALEEVSGEPVGHIMDTWIFQGGYPVVDVAAHDGSVTLTQRQFRFLGDGDATWNVPVLYRSDSGAGKVLLGEEPSTIDVGDGLVVNAGGEGFYRVAYDHDMFASIVDRLPQLEPIERFSIVSDVQAEMLSGGITAGDYLDLVQRLGDEPEIDVWRAAVSGIDEIDRVISPGYRDRLRSFVRDLVRTKADVLGWDPANGESDRTRALRGLIIRTLGNLGDDPDAIEMARTIEMSGHGVDAEVRDAALSVTADHGDLDDFERFLDMSKTAVTPQQTVKYLRAATQVPHEAVPGRLLDMVWAGEVRSQDSFWVIAALLGHRENGPRTWRLITEHWDELMVALAPNHRHRILDHVKYRSEPDVATSIREWFETHTFDGSERAVQQKLEMLDVRVGLRERESHRVGEHFG